MCSLEEDLGHLVSEASEIPEDDVDAVDAYSASAGSGKGFDPHVDAEYVQKLTICCVRTCKLCVHQSNEVNPLVNGYYARNTRFPTWPWHQGSYSKPKGRVCAICNWTFVFGKFDSDFTSIDELAEAFRRPKEGQTVTDEFQACHALTVQKINAKKIPMRVRGRKKAQIQAQQQAERERTVQLIKASGMRVRSKFKAVPVATWEKNNPNSDINDQLVSKIDYPGRGIIPCVLFRKGDEDEVDVDFETSLHIALSEHVISSDQAVRGNKELDAHFGEHADMLSNAQRQRGQAQPVKRQPPAPGPAQGLENPEGAAGAKSDGDSHSSSDDSEDDGAPSFVNSLIAQLMPAKTRAAHPSKAGSASAAGTSSRGTARGGAKQTKAATSSAGASASSAAASAPPAAAAAAAAGLVGRQQPSTSPAKPGKGRGKSARIPVDPHELLIFEGAAPLLTRLDELKATAKSGIMNSVHPEGKKGV